MKDSYKDNRPINRSYWRRAGGDLPLCSPGFEEYIAQWLARKNIRLTRRACRRALLAAAVYQEIYEDESYALDAALLQASGAEKLVRGFSFFTYIRILPAGALDMIHKYN